MTTADPAEPTGRSRRVFATADGGQRMTLDVPYGLITPPTIDLHKPLEGPVTFYDAEAYQIPLRDES